MTPCAQIHFTESQVMFPVYLELISAIGSSLIFFYSEEQRSFLNAVTSYVNFGEDKVLRSLVKER